MLYQPGTKNLQLNLGRLPENAAEHLAALGSARSDSKGCRQLGGQFPEEFEWYERGLAVMFAFEDADKAAGRRFLDF